MTQRDRVREWDLGSKNREVDGVHIPVTMVGCARRFW